MFCRVCGEKNDETSLYCSKDGERLDKDNKSLNLVNGNTKFCKDCGQAVATSDLYCLNCSSSLYIVEEYKNSNKEKCLQDIKLKSKFDIVDLFKYSAIASGLVLLISIIISSFINTKFIELMSKELEFDITNKLINFLDVSSILNGFSLNIGLISNGANLLDINLNSMFFILALIPIAIFSIMGIYISITHKKREQRLEIKDCLVIALFYGGIISLLSLFASRKMDLNIPGLFDEFGIGKIVFAKKYGFLSAFINSSILSLFSLGLGNGIYSLFVNMRDKEDKFNPLASSAFIFVVSSIFVVGFILFEDLGNSGFDMTGSGALLGKMTILQMFIYLLLFVNMGTFKMGYETDFIKASLFSNMDGFKETFANAQFLYIGLFVSIALFFLIGRNLRKKGYQLKMIFYTPTLFSLGLGTLAYLISTNISMTGISEYSFNSIGFDFLEFSSISIFISSFIIFSLSSFGGYLLTNGGKERVASHE
ncbi:zinc ribbon domain-containing protein [Tissierella creatinophila]|uniref:Double zinc ribbon n=1 Tax=Tissierella creatinophila DSM 6911 TaxID=1123403 RepID=A0A1U7M5L3_TISCR|nr:zinc ribbon domain-containing protein [Tissierella creatinophila]OLS02614.1 double zinc ribbon [Tissierella creatinophila DSM 6911]